MECLLFALHFSPYPLKQHFLTPSVQSLIVIKFYMGIPTSGFIH